MKYPHYIPSPEGLHATAIRIPADYPHAWAYTAERVGDLICGEVSLFPVVRSQRGLKAGRIVRRDMIRLCQWPEVFDRAEAWIAAQETQRRAA